MWKSLEDVIGLIKWPRSRLNWKQFTQLCKKEASPPLLDNTIITLFFILWFMIPDNHYNLDPWKTTLHNQPAHDALTADSTYSTVYWDHYFTRTKRVTLNVLHHVHSIPLLLPSNSSTSTRLCRNSDTNSIVKLLSWRHTTTSYNLFGTW